LSHWTKLTIWMIASSQELTKEDYSKDCLYARLSKPRSEYSFFLKGRRNMQEQDVHMHVNGKLVSGKVESRTHLGDFLRQTVGLTGTHLGCEHGVCGACTVIVDGDAVRSCLMLAVQAENCKVTTIEGIAEEDGSLHPLQEAFRSNHALQCGFCTAGMITSLYAFLSENPVRSETEIREAISGNICRCTGYQGIVSAAMEAAEKLNKR
jgi:carbon-monoxide dehydrogenase small subunit